MYINQECKKSASIKGLEIALVKDLKNGLNQGYTKVP